MTTIYRGRKTGEGTVVTADGQLLPRPEDGNWDWGYYGGALDRLVRAVALHYAYTHAGFPLGPTTRLRKWLAEVQGEYWALHSADIADMVKPVPEERCDVCTQLPCRCDDFGKGLMPVAVKHDVLETVSRNRHNADLPKPVPVPTIELPNKFPRVAHFHQIPADCPHCRLGIRGALKIRLTTATSPVDYLPNSIEGDGTEVRIAWIMASALAGPGEGSRKEGRRVATERLKKTVDRIRGTGMTDRIFALKELNCLGFNNASGTLASETPGIRVFWSLQDLKSYNRGLRAVEATGSHGDQERAYRATFTATDLIRK